MRREKGRWGWAGLAKEPGILGAKQRQLCMGASGTLAVLCCPRILTPAALGRILSGRKCLLDTAAQYLGHLGFVNCGLVVNNH